MHRNRIHATLLFIAGLLSCTNLYADDITFRRITTTDDLEVGKRYLIVCEEYNVVMGGSITGNYMSALSVSISNHEIIISSANRTINMFKLSVSSGSYSLWQSVDNKYIGWTTSTNFVFDTSKSSKYYQWGIVFTDAGNVRINGGDNATRHIRCYEGANFKLYQSTVEGKPIQLYKEVEASSKLTPTISVSDNNVTYGETYTIDTSGFASGTVSATSSNEAVATVSGTTITPQAVGSTTITVSTAENETYESGSQSFTLTVNAPTAQTTAEDGTTVDVTLNAYGYATLCSSYPLTFNVGNDYAAWRITTIDGENITFERVLGSVRGGTGLLISGAPNSTVTLSATNSTATLDANILVGTLAPTYFATEAEAYGLTGKTFVPNSAASTMRSNKAYIPAHAIDADIKAFVFNFKDNATSTPHITQGEKATPPQ